MFQTLYLYVRLQTLNHPVTYLLVIHRFYWYPKTQQKYLKLTDQCIQAEQHPSRYSLRAQLKFKTTQNYCGIFQM